VLFSLQEEPQDFIGSAMIQFDFVAKMPKITMTVGAGVDYLAIADSPMQG
jgi:hypothetical protein